MERNINLSAWLGCNVDQAFKMFTNKEHLQEWLPVVSNVEPGIGGKYEISWTRKVQNSNNNNKDNKENVTIGCKIVAYKPNRYLAFEWKNHAEESSMASSEVRTLVTVFFISMNENSKKKMPFTEVRLMHTGWKDSDDDEKVKAWFENTWTNGFEKLIEHINELEE